MSILAAFRQTNNIAKYPTSASTTMINITGFKPSGIEYGNLLGVALYVWSGSSYSNGNWVPCDVRWLK